MYTEILPVHRRSDNSNHAETREQRPLWHDLAGRYTDEKECLASYLALEAAEVIGGAKPANLLNLTDRERPCGRNLFRLWRRHGMRLLKRSGLAARELVSRDDGVLLLIYHPKRLDAHLADPRVTNFLRRAGYHQPEHLETALVELTGRLIACGDFPHEIGALLGYPLKDVAGFMGWAKLPSTCGGPWKIFGDPQPSLDVVAACRNCRKHVARWLSAGVSPFECLLESGRTTFFQSKIENEYRYHTQTARR